MGSWNAAGLSLHPPQHTVHACWVEMHGDLAIPMPRPSMTGNAVCSSAAVGAPEATNCPWSCQSVGNAQCAKPACRHFLHAGRQALLLSGGTPIDMASLPLSRLLPMR